MPVTAPEHGRELPAGVLGPHEPEDVLYEAEEPVIYTLRTGFGQRVLAYLADATATARWIIMCPCSDTVLEDLRTGRVPVRDALSASWLWLAELDNDDEWKNAWAVGLADLPENHLPRHGVMLLPEHEPVLSTRAVGQGIGRASTPASVVAYVADHTRRALKGLLEFELDLAGTGRPPEDLRTLYDLPVQRMAYRSFEISFAAPVRLFDDPALERSLKLLRRGLRWAAAEQDEPLAAETDQERDAVLRALKHLTPPTTGAIERIDVAGRWMKRRTTTLTRDARRRVQAELRQIATERVGQFEGRIREFDKDNYTFILRDTPDGTDVRGVIDEELFDEFLDYFTNDDRVTVAGVLRSGKLFVAAAARADDEVPAPEGE